MMAKNMHGSMGALLQAIHSANDPANLDQRSALMQASQQQLPLYKDLHELAAQVRRAEKIEIIGGDLNHSFLFIYLFICLIAHSFILHFLFIFIYFLLCSCIF
jgi:hypothetical protein